MSAETNGQTDFPAAVVKPRRRVSLAWIVPVLALALAGGLVYRAWIMRGEHITITFHDGHGLRPGDEVRYRGIIVGEVEDIELSDDVDETVVTIALREQPNRIARQGTLFWIARPHIGPEGVSGLDTVMGPRYITLRPGSENAPRRDDFVGLEEPPVVTEIHEGDLEIIVESPGRGSLQSGGPVMFRGFRVGTVLSVNLASDGSAVEARLHIEAAYAPLVRERSVFWDSGGATVDVGLTGVSVDMDSLASVIVGSVSFATPPDPGRPVSTGERFTLAPEVDPTWLAWKPTLAVGSDLLPPGSRIPHLERARLNWETKVLRLDRSRSAWVLATESGVLGPADVLTLKQDVLDGSARLVIAGKQAPLSNRAAWEANGLAYIETDALQRSPWPRDLMRAASEPEDCLIVASGVTQSMPLAAVRVRPGDGFWRIDEAISFDQRWHGACILSRIDGMLVGLLLVEDGIGRVGLIPQSALE